MDGLLASAAASNSNNAAAMAGGSISAANGSALGDRKVSRMQMGKPIYIPTYLYKLQGRRSYKSKGWEGSSNPRLMGKP